MTRICVEDHDGAGVSLGSMVTSRVGNPYFFTGRRLDVLDVNDNGTPHRFTDDVAGLTIYDFRARKMDPVLGRFLQRDPVHYAGGMDLYEYVGSVPAHSVDPLGLVRWPDYFSVNINFGFPWIGWTGQLVIDRHGSFYVAPIGVTVGKSLTIVSGSATVGWLNSCGEPAPMVLQNFLTSNSFNVAGGFWAGGGLTYTPGSGTATEAGFFTPQVGGSWHYSWLVGNTGLAW